jgi:uncharacterized protein (DUF433 family)
MITILATILLPVRERARFLQEFKLKAKQVREVIEYATSFLDSAVQ